LPRLTIIPSEIIIDAEEGATIMESAWAQDLYWPTTCGGQGICTSCVCKIQEGAEGLAEMGRSEHKRLVEEFGEAAVRTRGLRLACQARVRGDVIIEKRGVRPAGQSLLDDPSRRW
jgi:2Fe-2S ferredoxin